MGMRRMKIKEKIEKIENRLAVFSERTISNLGVLVTALLFALSLIFTVTFQDGYTEIPVIGWDKAPFVALFAGTFLLLIGILHKKNILSKADQKKILVGLMVFAYFFGAVWVMISHSFPVADRDHVSEAAIGFLNGDYSLLMTGGYLFIYPYQLTYVAFLELCYYLTGNGYYFFPQMINAVAVALIFYHIYRLTEELFEEKLVSLLALILSFGGISLMFFCTYVYGNILGLCFSLWAVRELIKFLKKGKLRHGISAAILISLGSLLKNNFILFLIAMAVILFVAYCREKKPVYLVVLVCCFLVRTVFDHGLERYYEERSNIEIGDGQPMLGSLAMGLRDDGNAPGWHNGFDINIYRESQFDEEVTVQKAKDSIRGSLSKMKNPGYAFQFFYQKTVTQWCEPTYQALWDSNCSNNHTMELSDLTDSIYYGGWNRFFVMIMDVFQTLVWGLSFYGLLKGRKELQGAVLVLPLILLGGFVFQLFWEAKAQYNIQYMMVMLPVAAYGLKRLLERIPGQK